MPESSSVARALRALRALRVVPVLLVLTACSAAEPASAAQVWTTHATEKIRPAVPPRVAPRATIAAARNEFEAFQVVVSGAAANVRAVASPLAGPATIPAPRLHREAIIDLEFASALDGDTGPWPDALVPDVDELVGERRNAFPFTVPAGESRAIWVEVFVPPDARAGTYAGTVEVTWDGGAATVPVALTVWPFTLPSTASLRSTFKLSYGGLPEGHGVSGAAFSALRARYGALGLDHRISLSHHDDGSWSDLSHFDSYYGPLVDGTAPTRLGGAELTSIEYVGPLDGTGSMNTWTDYYRPRGWFERLFHYTCDEPPLTCAWSDIPQRAAAAKAADPEFRTLVTTSIQEADAHGVTSSIDLLVPVINYMHDKPGAKFPGDQRATYDAFLAGSPRRELWGYQSCMSHGCGGTVNFGDPSASDSYFTGWPSYMIDASAVRNRAMQWLAFRYRLAGELYYEVAMAYGRHDPWVSQWEFSGNGDGTLFYPGTPAKIGGTTHVPVASIRLKMIREGMEDYEYLKLLSDAGDEALAREIASGLFPSPYSTEVPPAQVMAARERIARRIAELIAPGEIPPAGDPSVDGSADPSATGAGEGTPPGAAAGGGCGTGDAAGLLALVGLAGAARPRRRRR